MKAKLDELAGTAWQDGGELSEADKRALDAALASVERDPRTGRSWAEVKARVVDRGPHGVFWRGLASP